MWHIYIQACTIWLMKDMFTFFQLQIMLGLKSRIYKTYLGFLDILQASQESSSDRPSKLLDNPTYEGIQLSMPRSPIKCMAGQVQPLPCQYIHCWHIAQQI